MATIRLQGRESSIDPFSLCAASLPGCPGWSAGFRFGFALLLRVSPRCRALPHRRRLNGLPRAPVHKLYRWDGLQVALKSVYPRCRWLLACIGLPRCLQPACGPPMRSRELPRPAVSVRLYRRCSEPVSQSRILSAVPMARPPGFPGSGPSVSPMILLRLAPWCGSSGSGW